MGADSSIWEAAAAIGQLIAAIAAVIGLLFVGRQLRASRQAFDLQNLQEFTRQITEREAAFLDSSDNERKVQAFIELLNFLESNALAFNAGLFPYVSRKLIRNSLINSVAAIQQQPIWCNKMLNAVRTPSTFEELCKFIASEKNSITAVAQNFAKNP